MVQLQVYNYLKTGTLSKCFATHRKLKDLCQTTRLHGNTSNFQIHLFCLSDFTAQIHIFMALGLSESSRAGIL